MSHSAVFTSSTGSPQKCLAMYIPTPISFGVLCRVGVNGLPLPGLALTLIHDNSSALETCQPRISKIFISAVCLNGVLTCSDDWMEDDVDKAPVESKLDISASSLPIRSLKSFSK